MSAGSGYGSNGSNGRSMQPSRLDYNHQVDPNQDRTGYSYARHQPFEPSLTSPPLNTRAGLNEFFSSPSSNVQSPPHPANFAQTLNPYGEPPFDPYPITSAPPPLQPLPPTKTVSPIAPNFTPTTQPQSQPQRSVSTSPTTLKRSLNPGAGSFAFKPATAPPSESDFPALSASSPSKPTSTQSSNNKVSAPPSTASVPPSVSNLSRSNTPSNVSVTSSAKSKGKGKSKKEESEGDGKDGESKEEVDLTTLIDQLYQAAEKIKQVQSSQDAQVALALAKEDELTKEREEKEKEKKEREKDKKRFEEETKRFEEEQKKLREKHELESRKRVVETKKMVTIHRGVQVELLPPPPPPIVPQRIPTPPPIPVRQSTPPPIASTSSSSAIPSSSTGPQPSQPLDFEAIGEYQRLLSNIQAKLSQVEQDKVALDHRIAQMVQEKETLWPEQRAVLMQKAEGEKRELEKKLEKALKRVEVLEKDRPAPVLRIGSGPPKFITPKSKASEASSGPDPRLVQLESRIAEIEGDLAEATGRAVTAEEALEEYQSRTDKLLEDQQNQIDSLSQKAEKSQEATQLAERKIAAIKKKAQELVESHQATLRERKVGEDEARNEMLRLKDEVKRVQEELDKEVQKSTRDLAASERRKIESKHQGVREADRMKFEKELGQLKAQLERERKAHEYELDERGLSHGEELGDLEYQLRDETEQHAREIDSLNKKHELEMNALRSQLQAATSNSKPSTNGSTSFHAKSTPTPSVAQPKPSSARPKVEIPIPRASMADQNESTKEVFSKLGEDWVNESIAGLV